MKTFFTRIIGLTSVLILLTVFTTPGNAGSVTDITFSFANGQVTGANAFYEFDIMAASNTEGTHFKLAQVYIDYNTAGFGTFVASNPNLVIKGALLATVDGPGADQGIYSVQWNDNSSSRIAISSNWSYDNNGGGSTAFNVSNILGSTPQVWAHVKIPILSSSETSDLSFNTAVTGFQNQQYYFFTDGPINTPTQDAAAATNYSPVNVGSGLEAPLPVELNSFKANIKGSNVELLWQTTTEVNNYGFEVERKASDDKSSEWNKVSFVKGNGNSNSVKDYTYTDKNFSGGTKFSYRLKQIDNDGSFTYSDMVEVEVVPDKFELYQNYPNPFNPATTIKFSLPQAGKVRLDIFNVIGQHIATLLDKEMEAGFYNIPFDASNLATGAYIYRIQSQNFSQTKKMLLIK